MVKHEGGGRVTNQRSNLIPRFFVSVFCCDWNLGGLDLFVLDWLSELEPGMDNAW